MIPPAYPGFEDRPRATLLRGVGALLLVAGVGANVWLLIAHGGHGWRLAVMLLAPGAILLFTAWLAENTPSMRGCLTLFALVLAAMAAFWAYVGVAMARSPQGEPPAILQGEPPPEAPADDAAPRDAQRERPQ